MQVHNYTVIFEPEDDGGYTVYCKVMDMYPYAQKWMWQVRVIALAKQEGTYAKRWSYSLKRHHLRRSGKDSTMKFMLQMWR